MSKRITIEELQSYLWNSAVLLRTNIDAGAYKQYIFPLLFFKRICDVYDEETAAALAVSFRMFVCVTSFYQSLQAMSSFILFSICATYCTLSL